MWKQVLGKSERIPRQELWGVAGWTLLYLSAAALIQFYVVAVPYDADTAYHAAVGRLIREHGILHAFPWTPFSWLSDHYADKELLFHLLFVPFAGLSWITASKIVGTICGAAILVGTYLVLRDLGVRFAGLWALMPLAASDVFLFRFALVRPHLLSIALAFAILWASVRGKTWFLAACALIYSWSYVAWQLPVALVLVSETARFFAGRRVRTKLVAVAAAGIALGLAIHPNSANLVRFNWIVAVDILLRNAWSNRAGFELGLEFQPFSAEQWLQWLLACTLMAALGLAIGWRNRRDREPDTLAFALAALAFGALTVKTARFAEYFIPFSVAAFALASRSMPWRLVPGIVLGCLVLYTARPASETLGELGSRIEYIPPKLADWLQERIPPGSQVFTTEWGHTGTMMLALPDRKFIVALDPTLFYIKSPALYQLWYRIPREAPVGVAQLIRERFGARYVLSFFDDRWVPLYYQFAREPGVRTLLNSDAWMLFDLGPPSKTSPG